MNYLVLFLLIVLLTNSIVRGKEVLIWLTFCFLAPLNSYIINIIEIKQISTYFLDTPTLIFQLRKSFCK